MPGETYDLDAVAARVVSEIQEQEDREVLWAIETGGPVTVTLPASPPGQVFRIVNTDQEDRRIVTVNPAPGQVLTREDFERARVSLLEPPRSSRMLMSQEDWADIVGPGAAMVLQAQVALETGSPRRASIQEWAAENLGEFFEASHVESPALRTGQVYVATEPEYVGRLPDQPRVQVPMFEMYSNPTIRVDDVRRRRFDLINRGGQDPVVQCLLDALIRKKIFSLSEPGSMRVPGAPKTVWEALLELDLVDE